MATVKLIPGAAPPDTRAGTVFYSQANRVIARRHQIPLRPRTAQQTLNIAVQHNAAQAWANLPPATRTKWEDLAGGAEPGYQLFQRAASNWGNRGEPFNPGGAEDPVLPPPSIASCSCSHGPFDLQLQVDGGPDAEFDDRITVRSAPALPTPTASLLRPARILDTYPYVPTPVALQGAYVRAWGVPPDALNWICMDVRLLDVSAQRMTQPTRHCCQCQTSENLCCDGLPDFITGHAFNRFGAAVDVPDTFSLAGGGDPPAYDSEPLPLSCGELSTALFCQDGSWVTEATTGDPAPTARVDTAQCEPTFEILCHYVLAPSCPGSFDCRYTL